MLEGRTDGRNVRKKEEILERRKEFWKEGRRVGKKERKW
jgi:hypothetical protein